MEMVKNAQPDSGESDSGQYQPQFQPMIRDLPKWRTTPGKAEGVRLPILE